MTEALLSIGQVADAVGVSVSAVRYYDKVGLIESSARVGGKRRFDPSTIERVSFVQRAKEAGFALDEVAAILDDTNGGWAAMVDAKLAELIERRDRLDTTIDVLRQIRACGCEVVVECPRFATDDGQQDRRLR